MRFYTPLLKSNGMGLTFALIISLSIAGFSTFIVSDYLQNKKMMQLINLRYTVEKLRKQIINTSLANVIKSINDPYNAKIKNCYANSICNAVRTFKPFKLLYPDGSIMGTGQGTFYNSSGTTCSHWSADCPIKLIVKAKISGGQLVLKYKIKVQETIGNVSSINGTVALSVDRINKSMQSIISCEDPKQLIGVSTDGTSICIPPKYKDVYIQIPL